jgi:hypothetical protein
MWYLCAKTPPESQKIQHGFASARPRRAGGGIPAVDFALCARDGLH